MKISRLRPLFRFDIVLRWFEIRVARDSPIDCELHCVFGNSLFFFFADSIPMCGNMLVSEDLANLFESPTLGFGKQKPDDW